MLKCKLLLPAVVAAAALFAPVGAGATSITVTPWLAPNAFGSPSFAGAEANAVQGMLNNGVAYGTPGTPTYFNPQSNVTSAQAIVTGFPSWLGQVDPGTVYGPAFANELGNRMTFALRIDGQGTPFSISQLSFTMTSTDPAGALDYSFPSGYNYGSGYWGVLPGPDGKLWTADDVYVTSGASTQLVYGLVGRGSGNSFAAYCSSCSLAQQQSALLASAAYPGSPFEFTGTYSLGTASGSGTFNVSPVPLPASAWFFVSGLVLLGGFGVRRGQRKSRSGPAVA